MKLTITYAPLRILTALLIIMMGVSMKHLGTLLAFVLFAALLQLGSRIPVAVMWRRLKLALPFMAFSFVYFGLFSGGMLVHPLGIPISVDGLHQAVTYALRLLVSLQVLTLLFFNLSHNEFFQALLKLRLPGIFVELILFTLRFMNVFRSEGVQMLSALKSRGFSAGSYYRLSRYIVLARLLGSLLLRALRRSERIYMGMMSRNYRGIPMQQELRPLRSVDWGVMLLWVLPCLTLFLFDLR
ncbi:cobalt ECF transporter T component CbiQ [Paenibacillus koleovorans]|uniref:cobalt ECF transporter T component CbiQ n=1 Tax=Paenibacillus koleovorans TaxID=121608 RepID=UPI000FDC7AFC|nr:cobalt ECF transporter T component CbiQ [Paenibacillus koleovorans]